MLKKILFSLSLTCLATPLLAHVSLEEKQAEIGSGYKATFRVPHGCGGQATIGLRVEIPVGVIAVKPMPKAGWSLEKITASYEKHYVYHGAHLMEGVKEVIWSGGNLADDEYDEFILRATISDDFKDGDNVYFAVMQQCANGAEAAWTQIPASGQNPHDLPLPAPALHLIKENHEHHHHHH